MSRMRKQLQVRCSDVQIERWRTAATQSGLQMTEWVRRVLDMAAYDAPEDIYRRR